MPDSPSDDSMSQGLGLSGGGEEHADCADCGSSPKKAAKAPKKKAAAKKVAKTPTTGERTSSRPSAPRVMHTAINFIKLKVPNTTKPAKSIKAKPAKAKSSKVKSTKAKGKSTKAKAAKAKTAKSKA